MDNYPVVYIVVLNFNSYEDTLKCVKSIERISYPNYRVVIVDNNSSDNSFEILSEKLSNHTLLLSNKNFGYANGNNLGIKYAIDNDAQYICILNNDVEVEEDFLEPLIYTLQNDKTIGMVGPCICDYEKRDIIQSMGANINLYTGLTQGKYKGIKYESIKEDMVDVDYLGGACFVVRADIIREFGMMPENYFLFFEETEFCFNIKRNGYRLACLRNSRVYHKRSATISKFKGLGYYFLNRNRIIFMRRNAKLFQRIIFYIYVFVEGIGRIIIRREPLELFKIYRDGLIADIDKLDIDGVKRYLNEK